MPRKYYTTDNAYQALQKLVDADLSFDEFMKQAWDHCEELCPDNLWAELRAWELDTPEQTAEDFEEPFRDGWDDPEKGKFWPALNDEVEVLWVALWDVPAGYDLRGASSWSRKRDDWDWTCEDDYSNGTWYARGWPELLEKAREIHHNFEGPDEFDRREPSLYGVLDFFMAPAFHGALAAHAARLMDPTTILGGRYERYFVVNHPDALDGVILGKLTKSGWIPGLKALK